MDKLSKSSSTKNNILLLVGIVYFFLLPFPRKVQMPFLVLFVLVFLVSTVKKRILKEPINWTWGWVELSLGMIFIFELSSLLYTANLKEGVDQLIRKIPFLLIPVVFLLHRNFFKLRQTALSSAFLIGLIVYCCYCLLLACFNAISIIDGELIFQPSLNASRGFFEATLYEGNYFMEKKLSHNIHPSYFSLNLIIGQVFLLQMIERRQRIGFFLVLLAMLIFVFLLSSRIMIFLNVFTIFIYFISIFGKTPKLRLIIIVSTIVISSAVATNPRFQGSLQQILNDVFRDTPVTELNSNRDNRVLAWKAAIEICKNNFLIGVGIGDTYDQLNNEFIKRDQLYLATQSYNAHNQFLQIVLEIGLLGLLCLICIFIKLMVSGKLFTGLVGFMFFVFFLIESPLMVFHGIITFTLITCFLIAISDETHLSFNNSAR